MGTCRNMEKRNNGVKGAQLKLLKGELGRGADQHPAPMQKYTTRTTT